LMSIVYIGFGLVVIFVNYERIPAMVGLVFKGAFTPVAIAGGVLGYGFKASIRYGIARGFFSNGGGQGIFSIAHASAKVENPIDQAIWAIEEIFVDCTICLISAITIITSGIALDPASAATIVNKAFSQTFGFMGYIVAFSVLMFTFTTVAGFCYMGEAQLSQLMKPKYAKIYRYVFIVLCYVGAMSELTAIWNFTDALAGLIMFINLIVLVVLSPQVRRLTSEYFAKPAAGAASKTR